MEVNNLDIQYQNLLRDILDNGVEKNDRTGTGTLSVFGRQIRHNMSEGFPLLTTKKVAWKTMVTELRWFLKGDTNIKYLVDNGCNIWNGDAYKQYQRACLYELDREELSYDEFMERIKTDDDFANVWGGLGPIYGKQWRNWDKHTDQIFNLIQDIQNNPDSRRLMVNSWNVGELGQMALPPCHYGFQIYIQGEYMSLMWNQRSVDTFLGLPFNIASYGLLLSLLAEYLDYKPGELIGNLGDVHLYKNHIDAAKEQLKRQPFNLPELGIIEPVFRTGNFEVQLYNYKSHPTIKAPLSN